MENIPFGPNYEEMLYPQKIPDHIRDKALDVLKNDEFDPLNFFNITWKNQDNLVRKVILPPELTGVDANIVVLLGKYFPSGSHKVGPAYSTLIEGCVDGDIIPGKHTILSPSTGNFGIGTAYISKLMGYKCIVIMPDSMSKERYDTIQSYGADLELTPGTESDVILTLKKTHEMGQDPHNVALAQFELMPNYRFHRYVTGNSAIEAVKGIGNERVSCFVSAPGSAGTLGAGDEIKQTFPEAKIVAVEPYECPTLAIGGKGQHRIEGIGDKMCTLIHNVLNTDFVALVKDEDSVRGLKLLNGGTDILVRHGIHRDTAASMSELFGISTICNIIAAIKVAKYLKLGPNDNIVTIATDGIDRYESVLDELEKWELEISPEVLERWYQDIFLKAGEDEIYDFRKREMKEKLFQQKEKDWKPFGYSQEYFEAMKDMDFWDRAYEKTFEYNEKILQWRE